MSVNVQNMRAYIQDDRLLRIRRLQHFGQIFRLDEMWASWGKVVILRQGAQRDETDGNEHEYLAIHGKTS
jgi:hypothetical protein